MKMKWLTPILMVCFALSATAAVVGEFQIYVGNFASGQDQTFTSTIPDGKMIPAMDFRMASHIQKTFNLKNIELVGTPTIISEVGKSTNIAWGPVAEDRPDTPSPKYTMNWKVLSVNNDKAHYRLALQVDDRQEGSSEFINTLGKPAALTSRIGDRMLFILCTVRDGNVKLVKPKLIKRVAPEYPPDMQKKGISGKVVVNLTVDTHGRPTKIEVLDSPDPAFSRAAADAVRQWVFEPGTRNGEPVDMEMVVQVAFKLN